MRKKKPHGWGYNLTYSIFSIRQYPISFRIFSVGGLILRNTILTALGVTPICLANNFDLPLKFFAICILISVIISSSVML